VDRLSNEDTKKLRNAFDTTTTRMFKDSKGPKVVASILSNCANLKEIFEPDFVICDESGQRLEGEHMITMTITSVKGVILIGNPCNCLRLSSVSTPITKAPHT
jgi:hypothetical protein